eukprot:Gb_35607 [translate_table: standard]
MNFCMNEQFPEISIRWNMTSVLRVATQFRVFARRLARASRQLTTFRRCCPLDITVKSLDTCFSFGGNST